MYGDNQKCNAGEFQIEWVVFVHDVILTQM